MTGFDFVFALFSLLLGLGMTEILAGFSRVLRLEARARVGTERRVRVGWLVPLLAIYLLMNQLSFWMVAYSLRDALPLTYPTLVAVTAIVGGYYLFATLVFPDEPEDWPDFDLYYDLHNRFILVGMLITTVLIVVVTNVYAPPVTAAQKAARETAPANIAALASFAALAANVALVFVKGRRLNVVLLALLCCFNLAAAFLLMAAGL